MIQHNIYAIFLPLFCVAFCVACVSASKLYAPFDVLEVQQRKGQEDLENFVCKAAPSPVKNLKFQRFYEDKYGSRINEEIHKKYKIAYRPLRDYETQVVSLANRYVASKHARADYAACTLEWLDHWANSGALLGEVSANGEYIRKWVLASLSSAYIQVKGEQSLNAMQKLRVEKWLHKIGRIVIKDYSTKTERRSRQNNHLYWAAWSVAITAVAVQDTSFFEWSMRKAGFGVGQIKTDGTLPHELYRKSMALHYHLFATVPLVMLAEIGQANGYDLYNQNNGALHRLIKRALKGLDDPEYIAKKAKAEQDMVKAGSKSLLSWIEVYHARFPERETARIKRWLKRYRPVIYSRIGGDTTLLFSHSRYPE